jgi:1-acyl-sn-glycerol-3-phosphate acyltransferase
VVWEVLVLQEIQTVASATIGFRTERIDLGALGTLRVKKPYINPKRFRRRVLHGVAHAFHDLMTRTNVYGLENIPAKGPLLILPNHVSNLDGILVLAYYPRQIEMVGPGDFKMITIKDWILRAYGVTPINRGHADTGSLKAITGHLRGGNDLMMFPSGGMWEKRRFEAKEGAAYLSQLTGTPILPVGVSGTYLKSMAAFLGMQPKLTLRFGKVMPPVPRSQDRRARETDLAAASREIMDRIYDLLEPDEKAQYERWAREIYSMRVEFERIEDGEPLAYDGLALPDMAMLAEFVAKPNLFRPMWENARLMLEPFREARYFPPIELRMAALDLHRVLNAEYDRYIPYRMGDEAATKVNEALVALHTTVCDWAMRHNARVRLTPECIDPDA